MGRSALAGWLTCVTFAALGPAVSAGAAEVRIALEREVTFDNQPVVLQVEVIGPDRDTGEPVVPPVDGLEIRGPSGRSTMTSIVNRTQTTSYRYSFAVIPQPGRLGEFTIGPVRVPMGGGKVLESQTVRLTVAKQPEKGILFTAEPEVKTARIGVPFRVVYTIFYSGQVYEGSGGFGLLSTSRHPLGLASLDVPLLRRADLKVEPVAVDGRRAATQLRIGDGQALLVQSGSTSHDGKAYRVRCFALRVTPHEAGQIDVGGASASLMLEDGYRYTRDFFRGRVRVPDYKEFRAATGTVTVPVEPLPTEGRPALFAGAIGRFAIDVTTEDTQVDAFAPINLEVTVRGRGLLEGLVLPPWPDLEELTRDFEVATDVDAGQIEGDTRVFHQTIRPRSAEVTRIPPLPLPHFDPKAEAYRVAYSKPIPIQVRAVRTVGADEAIVAQPTPAATQPSRRAPDELVQQVGIGANFDTLGTLLPSLRPTARLTTAGFLAAVGVPPLLFIVARAWRRYGQRDPAVRRARGALAVARRRLRNPKAPLDELHEAFAGYFRDRLELPAGQLTPKELAERLGARKMDGDLVERASRMLDRLAAARFGGSADDHAAGREALRILQEVERCLR